MCRRCRRDGLTLVELMIGMSLLAMVLAVLGTLGVGVERTYEYTEGYGEATQHARVALDRIGRSVDGATANDKFPGFIVLSGADGAWKFPDTLVVWHPSGTPADAAGLPRFSELVIYCADAESPNCLVEITVPSDTRVVPDVSDTARWLSEIDSIKRGIAKQSTTLTSLMRTCSVTDQAPYRWRGAVRFEQRLLPSDDEYARYKNGTLDWTALSWPQTRYGSQTGQRQAWLRCELQLMPGDAWSSNNPAARQAVPFFSSATVYYQLAR